MSNKRLFKSTQKIEKPLHDVNFKKLNLGRHATYGTMEQIYNLGSKIKLQFEHKPLVKIEEEFLKTELE